MKKAKMIFPIFWLLVLLALGSYYIWGDDHKASYNEDENRMLAAFPAIKDAIVKSSLDSEVEAYFLEHFPKRNQVIQLSYNIKDKMSISTLQEYMLVKEEKNDNLDTSVDENLIADILNGNTPKPVATEVPTVEPTKAAVIIPTEAPQSTEAPSTTEAPLPTEIHLPTDTPTPAIPAEYPPIEPKPEANIEDFAETLKTYMTVGTKEKVFSSYSRNSVLAFTMVLNKYANILPEGGKLMFTLVPSASRVTQKYTANSTCTIYSEAIPLINAFGVDNVYAFDAGNILSEELNNGGYLFFTSDMHWTPYASYLVYREMVARAGLPAADYENDFNHTTEYPFLGTYYRDNPTNAMKENPDTLELLEPKFAHELRRITGKDEYKVIPYLDFNAKKNDRYTVYLGGPAGPWTYVECDNDATENCLVIMDSFGLGYFTYLTQNYKQVHYYDPRYFDKGIVGYSVSEMMELYDIKDVYVVVGDLHSFDSSFILNNANKQFDN